MSRSFLGVINLAFFLVFCVDKLVYSQTRQFDCLFKNDNYFMNERSVTPRWYKRPTPIIVKDRASLQSLLSSVESYYKLTLQDTTFDSIKPFLKFHEEYVKYKNRQNAKLAEFYSKYEQQNLYRESGLSLAMEFLIGVNTKISRFIPHGETRGYLASSPVFLNREALNKENWTEYNENREFMRNSLHSERFINAAGVLKVRVENETNPMTVFIICHPEYFFRKPIVLVRDHPNDVLNTRTAAFSGAKYSFDFFNPHMDYVLITKYLKGSNDVITGYDIIYLGESYCSGMETTDKRALLNPEKFIERRSRSARNIGLRVDLKAAVKAVDTSCPDVETSLRRVIINLENSSETDSRQKSNYENEGDSNKRKNKDDDPTSMMKRTSKRVKVPPKKYIEEGSRNEQTTKIGDCTKRTSSRIKTPPKKFIDKGSRNERIIEIGESSNPAKNTTDKYCTAIFTTYYIDQNKKNRFTEQVIKFPKNASDTLVLDAEEKEHLEFIAGALKYSDRTLNDRLCRLNKILLTDKQFIEDVITLYYQYKNIKITSHS